MFATHMKLSRTLRRACASFSLGLTLLPSVRYHGCRSASGNSQPNLIWKGTRYLKHSRPLPQFSRATASSPATVTPDKSASCFAVLGLPEVFELPIEQLVSAHRQLQQVWHPDRFANADQQTMLRAAEQSAKISNAYTTLKAPDTRAMHLLALRGVTIDEQTTFPDALDKDFLDWVVATRETIESTTDESELRHLKNQITRSSKSCYGVLSRAFSADDLPRATKEAIRLRYLSRIMAAADDRLFAEFDKMCT